MATKRRGKARMKAAEYEDKCLRRMDEIEGEMEVINDKKDAKWRRLRKQRIAIEARVRNTIKDESVNELNQTLNKVIKATLILTEAALPSHRVDSFLKDI